MTAPAVTQLAGKTIVVTGGSMGLGLEAARACRRYGANVAIVARGRESLTEATAALQTTDGLGTIFSVAANVGDERAVEGLFNEVLTRFGKCDGVIHAAGILGPSGPIVDLDASAWLETLRINLFGTFLVTRAAARRMLPGARIVLFAGGGASFPFPHQSAYAASKVAVVRFAETAALEFAPHIEINALAPGLVLTRMAEEMLAANGRDAEGAIPASVSAEAAAFLVSDAAQGITGRFVSAQHDDYRNWTTRGAPLDEGDLFALRRILPRDRGLDWQ